MGLKMVAVNKNCGVRSLLEVSGINEIASVSDFAFGVVPRINAAGRIKTASLAVERFLSEDRSRALESAEELCRTNKERQAEENKIMQEAYQKIEQYDIDKNPVIVLDADNWHHGVIGIVASRITEKYARP